MESQSAELLTLQLSHRHQPGTDVMSKLILLDTTVINMITETILGPNAKDLYSPQPTEWPNGTISDILYLPNSIETNFPPVLIEVQHTVNNDYIMKLMTYGISVYRQHKKIPPIFIIFVISSMKYEVSKKTVRDKKLPFLLRYPCEPWAQICYFVSDDSLQSSLTLPLSPFIALSNFLIDRSPSLSENPFNVDPTIQLLYSIATRISQDKITKSEKYAEDVLQLCQQAETTITQAISTLHKEIPDITMWSRTKKILDDGKLTPRTFKRKYETILDPDDSSYLNTPTVSNNNISTNTYAIDNNININTNANHNWEYVEQALSNRIDGVPIPWQRIYDDGRALGLFLKYTKWSAMKSNYYRWKKKQS